MRRNSTRNPQNHSNSVRQLVPSPSGNLAVSPGLAELETLFGSKAILEARRRLDAVRQFASLKPKTALISGKRRPNEKAEQLAQSFGVAVRTIEHWHHLYRQAHRAAGRDRVLAARQGFEALVTRRRGVVIDVTHDRRVRITEPIRQVIAGFYARRNRPSMAKVWRRLQDCGPHCRAGRLVARNKNFFGLNKLHVCADCGYGISYSTVRRVVKSLPPSVQCLGREGPRAFQQKFGIYIPRSYEDLRHREIFCGDHHEFDLFVYTRGGKLIRPWLSAWLDLKTEVLTGWYISERPSSSTIALALRHAVLPKPEGIMGLPESVYVDHGKDFRSRYLEGSEKRLGRIPSERMELFAQAHGLHVFNPRQIEGVWRALGVRVRHANPYNPQAKPIERFFGTLERDFIQDLPGWCGSKTELRPVDILKDQVREHQAWLEGKAEDTPFLHIAEFALEFEHWIYQAYLRRSHARLKRSPLEAYQAEYGTPRLMEERALDLLLMRAEKRLIRRNGIEMFERNRWYWHERLLGREGTQVEVRWDPRNLGKILVYAREGFLCGAFNQELLGFHATTEEFRRYKQMKKLQREVATAQLALMHMAADGISMLEAATGRPRPKRLVQAQPLGIGGGGMKTEGTAPVFTSRAAREAWEKKQHNNNR